MRNNAREEILMATDGGLDVFRFYLPGYPIPSRVNFPSPFYEDGVASCNVFRGRDGIWRYKDHGDGGQDTGDCFWLVGRLYDKNLRSQFPEVLDLIIKDMGLHVRSPLAEQERKQSGEPVRVAPQRRFDREGAAYREAPAPRPFSYEPKPYGDKELAFWHQYGITSEVLTKYMVYNLKDFSSVSRAGKPYTIYATPREPIFGYVGDNNIKIYRPNSKLRFLSGGVRHHDYVFGLEQLPPKGERVIITGGEKDVLSLASHGFNAIALNSETATISSELVENLRSRFHQLYVCYDMDDTGLKASARLHDEYPDIKVLHLPLDGSKPAKDISDFFRLGGTAEELNYFIKANNLSDDDLWQEMYEREGELQEKLLLVYEARMQPFYEETLKRVVGDGLDSTNMKLKPLPNETEITQMIEIDGVSTGLYHYYNTGVGGHGFYEHEFIGREGFHYNHQELQDFLADLSKGAMKGRLHFYGEAGYVTKTIADFIEVDRRVHSRNPEYHKQLGVSERELQTLFSISKPLRLEKPLELKKSSIVVEAERTIGSDWKSEEREEQMQHQSRCMKL